MDYDFVIVGAGSAGCVLAERLTANGRHKVLLLEAGGSDMSFYIQMPLGYGKTFFDTKVNWAYRAEPDFGLNGQRDYWPRGKVLGGSSSINAMVYIRGSADDFADWEGAGNPGWDWYHVANAYREIEDYEDGDPREHGRGGPLHIKRLGKEAHPLCDAYLKAANAIGIPTVKSFNHASQEGVGLYDTTIKGGRRMSAARAFLRPAMKRPNLRVETHAFVTGLIFDKTRVVGVRYEQRGQMHEARAGGEVILSGGAVNSPQLLQLSGIGPANLLQSHGITVRQGNENVGAHLQDHASLNYTWRMKVPTLNEALRPWWGKAIAGIRYLTTGSGPLSLSINQGGGFFKTDPALKRPNMQLYMQAFSTLIPKEGERPLLTPDPFPGASIGISNCRPTARGEIMIKSANPKDAPKIMPNAYGTDEDVREMLKGVKMLRKIAEHPEFAQFVDTELRPGPEVKSDDDLIHDFKQRSGTCYHVCGTARMSDDPARSVVNSKLKVHGVQGLRVVDASVFPNVISGNTNGPVMMVAWRAAKMILDEAR